MVALAEAVRLYSVPRVAEQLDTSLFTVYRLIKAGRIRAIRGGTKDTDIRVRADDLQDYIDSLEPVSA